MMIKRLLHLIFVLTYLLSESEKRKHFRGCFVVFNELLILAWFNCFFAKKFSSDQRKW